MTDRQEHIKYLGLMIDQMNPPKPYRAALIDARNTLIAIETAEQAGMRSPDSWPYCSKCGKPYKGMPDDNNDVRDVVPDCGCKAEAVFEGRPIDNDWVHVGKDVTDWEQIAKAGGVEMVR